MRQVSQSLFCFSGSADSVLEIPDALPSPAFELAAEHDGQRLMACGGRNTEEALLSDAVIIDGSGAATVIAPLPEARCRHGIAVTPTGDFVVVGGVVRQNNGALAVTDEILVYCEKEDEWRHYACVPRAAAKMVVEVIGNELFVIAGDTGVATTPGQRAAPARVRDDVQILELTTGRWRFGRPKPLPETGVTSAVQGDEIWVVSSEDENGVVTDTVEIYNIHEDRWRRLPLMPTARTSVPCGFLRQRLYCIGGQGSNLMPTDNIEVFNPLTNTWSAEGHLPVGIYGGGYATSAERIWVLGGIQVRRQPTPFRSALHVV